MRFVLIAFSWALPSIGSLLLYAGLTDPLAVPAVLPVGLIWTVFGIPTAVWGTWYLWSGKRRL
jgi:hypothetical protein